MRRSDLDGAGAELRRRRARGVPHGRDLRRRRTDGPGGGRTGSRRDLRPEMGRHGCAVPAVDPAQPRHARHDPAGGRRSRPHQLRGLRRHLDIRRSDAIGQQPQQPHRRLRWQLPGGAGVRHAQHPRQLLPGSADRRSPIVAAFGLLCDRALAPAEVEQNREMLPAAPAVLGVNSLTKAYRMRYAVLYRAQQLEEVMESALLETDEERAATHSVRAGSAARPPYRPSDSALTSAGADR